MPKKIVHTETIFGLFHILTEIQQTPLESIEWWENGEPLVVDPKLIQEFKLTGLAHRDFILSGFYKQGWVKDRGEIGEKAECWVVPAQEFEALVYKHYGLPYSVRIHVQDETIDEQTEFYFTVQPQPLDFEDALALKNFQQQNKTTLCFPRAILQDLVNHKAIPSGVYIIHLKWY